MGASEAPSGSLQPGMEWRKTNVGRMLFEATDRCVRIKLQIVHQGGFDAVTEPQMALFQNLDISGNRLTTLSDRASLTKQAMIELIGRGEKLDLVERSADPTDARAKIVLFTPTGRLLLERIRDGMEQAETRIGAAVGNAFLVEAKSQLMVYTHSLEGQDNHIASADDPRAEWRNQNIGRLLALSSRRFAGEVMEHASQNGIHQISNVLLTLFRELDVDGSRLTSVALRARMTKQSMRELVDRAEALGFVARCKDPHDGRAKTVLFTAKGLTALSLMRDGVEMAEITMTDSLGLGFVPRLKLALSALIKDNSLL